jgi:hypothetical protein
MNPVDPVEREFDDTVQEPMLNVEAYAKIPPPLSVPVFIDTIELNTDTVAPMYKYIPPPDGAWFEDTVQPDIDAVDPDTYTPPA